MFRIDSDGATVGNLFTEGDPQTSVPATVVSADWLNAVQEEIAYVVEQAGLTLNKVDSTQLLTAILSLFTGGGLVSPITHTLANNTGPATVAGFPVLNKSNHLMRAAFFYIERKTDTQNVQECGILISRYDSADDNWSQESYSLFDDAGAVFSIDDADTDAAVLQVTTDDLTGTSYVGTLKLTQLIEIKA